MQNFVLGFPCRYAFELSIIWRTFKSMPLAHTFCYESRSVEQMHVRIKERLAKVERMKLPASVSDPVEKRKNL